MSSPNISCLNFETTNFLTRVQRSDNHVVHTWCTVNLRFMTTSKGASIISLPQLELRIPSFLVRLPVLHTHINSVVINYFSKYFFSTHCLQSYASTRASLLLGEEFIVTTRGGTKSRGMYIAWQLRPRLWQIDSMIDDDSHVQFINQTHSEYVKPAP